MFRSIASFFKKNFTSEKIARAAHTLIAVGTTLLKAVEMVQQLKSGFNGQMARSNHPFSAASV